MLSERAKANVFYGLIISIVACIYSLVTYDKPYPTYKYVTGIVISVVPVQSKYLVKLQARIRLENGDLIVKRASRSVGIEKGDRVNLHVYKSKLTGRVSYRYAVQPIASGRFDGSRLLTATVAGALGGGLGSAISRSAGLGILRTGTGRAATAGLGSAVIGGGAQTVNNRINGRPIGEGVANAALISGIGGALGQGGGEFAEELITELPMLGLRGSISGAGVAVGETIGNTISNTTTLIGGSQQCRP